VLYGGVDVGREVLPAQYAWEGKVLYQAASTIERMTFLDRYMEIIESLGGNERL
jgi:hypothetical protein